MKKIFTLFVSIASLSWHHAGAQSAITITGADFAYVGKQVLQAVDSTTIVTPGAAGANVTWNFSNITQEAVDTLTFTNPYWTPGGSTFPNATVAVELNGFQQFYQTTSSGLLLLGMGGDYFGNGEFIVAKNTPEEIVTKLPATYGTDWTNTFVSRAKFATGTPGYDSIRFVSHVTEIDSFDSWGSLVTPLGTFNTIRLVEYQHRIDSLDIYSSFTGDWTNFGAQEDSTRIYTWWGNGIGYPLMNMTMDMMTGEVSSVSWLKAMPAATSVGKVSGLEVLAYPNPASDAITFNLGNTEAEYITVFDVAGKQLSSTAVMAASTVVNTSEMQSGFYFYTVTGKNGNIVARGTFNVAH